MNPNRRQTPGFGVMLLLYQVFGVIGIDRIPPVTLTLIGLQVAIFLRLFHLPWHGLTDVCISFYKVFYKRQYSRLLFSAFVHTNDMHLYYNMVSFIVKGQSLERRFGSLKFLYVTSVFTILTNIMYLILARLAGEIDESFETQCAVGFSGVLFAMKTLTTYYDPNYSHYVMGIPILLPAKYAVWAELILIQVLMPNVSLLGHMGGVLVGLAYIMGPLKLVMDFVYNIILVLVNPTTLISRPQHRFTGRAEPSGRRPDSQFASYVPSGMSEEEQLRQATEASLQDNFAHQYQAPYPAPRQQPSSAVPCNIKEKRVVRFSWETLELPCEWESCSVVKNVMSDYIKHIGTYHVQKLTESDLHCHWKDCEAFTETLPDLHRHIFFHAFHTKIKCYGKNLQQRKKLPSCTLDDHSRNIIPELPDPLVCCWDDCEEVFDNPELFYRHLDFHAESGARKESHQDTSKCLWQGCNRDFANHYKVKDHMRSHTQEKLIACPTCGGMFASRTKFFDHIQRQTPINDGNVVFVCEYCSRKMKTERLLRDHMRHHVNHYKCPYCDMTCPTPSGLQTHVLYRHSNSKPYACQYCEYKCKSQRDLRKHLETHSTVPAFNCPYEGCDYASRSHACYNNHIRRKHATEKPSVYACHLCPKTFARGNYLTYHLTTCHKFRWPSGHCRFRYHQDKDGLFRLQTVRYESIELSESMICEDAVLCNDDEDVDSPDTVETASNSINQAKLNNEKHVPDTSSDVVKHSAPNDGLPGSSMEIHLPVVQYFHQPVLIALGDISQQNYGL